MSGGVLTELRKLRPGRRLTLDESLQIAEQQAARLLKVYGLSDVSEAPVPEELIADLPRFVVRRYPLGPTISGLAHWDRGRWCIALNSREPLVRQRFSLAHELGHIVEAPFDRYARAEHVERIADHFAASLLMPRPWVKQLWADGIQTQAELARHFAVSEVAMARRLSELRLGEADDNPVAVFGRHGPRYLRLAASRLRA
jgi:hypothetical protein